LIAHQVFQKIEPARGQVQSLAVSRQRVSAHVYFQITRAQSVHNFGSAAPAERPHPREQLGERKRLDQIIVRASIKTQSSIASRAVSISTGVFDPNGRSKRPR